MNVSSFTAPQLAFYHTFCNFDPKEEQLFALRSQGKTLIECAEIMHYEKIRDLSMRVNKKIIAVNNTGKMKEWIENVYWKNVLKD